MKIMSSAGSTRVYILYTVSICACTYVSYAYMYMHHMHVMS